MHIVMLGCRAKLAKDAAYVKIDYTTPTAKFSYCRVAGGGETSTE
jgi:hypothetical protein